MGTEDERVTGCDGFQGYPPHPRPRVETKVPTRHNPSPRTLDIPPGTVPALQRRHERRKGMRSVRAVLLSDGRWYDVLGHSFEAFASSGGGPETFGMDEGFRFLAVDGDMIEGRFASVRAVRRSGEVADDDWCDSVTADRAGLGASPESAPPGAGESARREHDRVLTATCPECRQPPGVQCRYQDGAARGRYLPSGLYHAGRTP